MASGVTNGARVVVVEPYEVVRRGLGTMLDALPDVAEWQCFASVADLETDGAIEPGDVLLLSVSAVEDHGQDVEVAAAVRTIVLIPSPDPAALEIATAIPANGYMLMADVSVGSLRAAVTQVRQDVMPLPDAVSSHLLRRARGDDPLSIWRSVRLSPREREVLDLLAAGSSNQQIAYELRISIHSAKRHVSNILRKLDSPSRAHLVSTALRSGVVRVGRA